jgi:tetratricopeptide (TPR) repeat protein
LEYNEEALSISKEINDLIGVSRGLNNIAADYANMGEFENFESYIRQAIIINKKTGQKLWEGINYFNLGIIHRENQKYDSAFFYYQKAENLFDQINNIPKKSAILGHFSKYYEETGKLDQSLVYAEKSYKLALEHQLKKPTYLAAKRLHIVYLTRNEIENAYKYSQIESQWKDSLDIENSTNRLLQLEMLYEFEKQEQIRILERERTQFQYILSTTIVVAIFVLIIILLIARHRIKVKNAFIKRKELENQIETKNKELTSNVMSLMRKNEYLSEVAEKLLRVKEEAVKDETKNAIEKLAKNLEKSNDKEIWEEFEVRFQQVHTDFYENLLKKYPNLTPSEQRLCAFLRLNMTTKEISELTGIRTNSLEISRSRLRKKLGISNTKENLVTFLTQI